MRLIVAGAVSGLVFGYVLQRGDICFHSTFRGLFEHRYALFKTWALGVAIAVIGLTAVFASGLWELNEALALRPVANALGGAILGAGMVVAASCNSGLFYKLGSGMLGAAVGLVGWAAGELAGARVRLPGPTLIAAGPEASLPGVLGLPRWAVAIPLASAVIVVVFRTGGREGREWRWGWPLAGTALGLVTVAAWVLAGSSGHSFGPSTVGAVEGLARGRPPWWLVAFLAALIPGALAGAVRSGGWWVRGERPSRYVGLLVGGFMLGAGARIAGGCNLGHGLSGMAQLGVSSIVAVLGIVGGVGVARAVQIRILREPDRTEVHSWTPRLRYEQS